MPQFNLLTELHRSHDWLCDRNILVPEQLVESLPTPTLRIAGCDVVSFCSNNYLGLSHHPRVMSAAARALETFSFATSESRRLGGNLAILEELENALARYKRMPAAMVTATGLLANVAAIHGIVDAAQLARRWYGAPADERTAVVLYDTESHRSIRMGARLGDAVRRPFRHNDADHLAELLHEHRGDAVLVITEGVFSMDGDLGNLPEIADVCDGVGALLLVDDAHGTGVYGPDGAGTVEHFGLTGRIPLQVATLSKAFGGMGGALLADERTVAMLRLFASGYRFTSSLPAEVAAGLLEAVMIAQREPALRSRLWENARRLRDGLAGLGLGVRGEGPIIPLIVGSSDTAMALEEQLLKRGFWSAAVAPPLVKPDECRLRLTVTAMHTPDQIDGLLTALSEILVPGAGYTLFP
jgi:8-amino-7-oxononanoate synthase